MNIRNYNVTNYVIHCLAMVACIPVCTLTSNGFHGFSHADDYIICSENKI